MVDRRSIDGRVTRVLDPGRLVERARALIEQGIAGEGGASRQEH